ncbi:MAG: iron-containing alcohol dehydrogenase, partial [Pseudomonadota bacterium]
MPVMSFLTTCIFDHGAIQRLPKVLAQNGVKRPVIVTDAGIKSAGILDTILDVMGTDPAAVFAETQPNPTEDE